MAKKTKRPTHTVCIKILNFYFFWMRYAALGKIIVCAVYGCQLSTSGTSRYTFIACIKLWKSSRQSKARQARQVSHLASQPQQPAMKYKPSNQPTNQANKHSQSVITQFNFILFFHFFLHRVTNKLSSLHIFTHTCTFGHKTNVAAATVVTVTIAAASRLPQNAKKWKIILCFFFCFIHFVFVLVENE